MDHRQVILVLGRRIAALALLATVVSACTKSAPEGRTQMSVHVAASFQVTSPAFKNDGPIPDANTAYGANQSPELHWTLPPEPARSIAVIVVDPDAPRGDFTHWVLFNLPGDCDGLPPNLPRTERLTSPSGVQGANDAGSIGYFGPRPPAGGPHHYHFMVYALDTVLNLNPGADRAKVEAAMGGHVKALGELIGTFQKQ